MEKNRAILYMECPIENKQTFTTVKEISEDDYIRMLREYSATLGMPERNNTSNRYNIQEVQQEQKKNIRKASVSLYGMDGYPCDVRALYDIEDSGPGIIIFKLEDNTPDEEFEEEFRVWKTESKKIISDNTINDERKIQFLPVKDFEILIDRHEFFLSGCKMYHEYEDGKMAFIIQRIKEI